MALVYAKLNAFQASPNGYVCYIDVIEWQPSNKIFTPSQVINRTIRVTELGGVDFTIEAGYIYFPYKTPY